MTYFFQKLVKNADSDATLLAHSKRSSEHYEQTCKALLFGMLTDVDLALTYFQHAQNINTDDWQQLLELSKYFSFTKYQQLKLPCRIQLFWLIDHLVALNASRVDALIIGILRNAHAGNHSEANLWTIRSVCKLLTCNQSWMLQQSNTVPFLLYSFLRLLAEDALPQDICDSLVSLSTLLFAHHWENCLVLGRDLVRCLIEVSKIDAFRSVWSQLLERNYIKNSHIADDDDDDDAKDGFHVPSTQLEALLGIETPRRFLMMRIAPNVERDLTFLLEECNPDRADFHIRLFVSKYVPIASDPGAFVADMIRFIVNRPLKTSSMGISSSLILVALLLELRASYDGPRVKLSLALDIMCQFLVSKSTPQSSEESATSVLHVIPFVLYCTLYFPKIACTVIEYFWIIRNRFFPELSQSFRKSLDKCMSIFQLSSDSISLDVNPNILLTSPNLPEAVRQMTAELFPSLTATANDLDRMVHMNPDELEDLCDDDKDALMAGLPRMLRNCVIRPHTVQEQVKKVMVILSVIKFLSIPMDLVSDSLRVLFYGSGHFRNSLMESWELSEWMLRGCFHSDLDYQFDGSEKLELLNFLGQIAFSIESQHLSNVLETVHQLIAIPDEASSVILIAAARHAEFDFSELSEEFRIWLSCIKDENLQAILSDQGILAATEDRSE